MSPSALSTPIKSKLWLILTLVLLLILTGVIVAIFLVDAQNAKTDRATAATLEVNPLAPDVNGRSVAELTATHAQLIMNPAVFARAISLEVGALGLPLNVPQLEWVTRDPATAADRLRAATRVEPIRNTATIRVRVSDPDPTTAATLANAVASAYEYQCRDLLLTNSNAALASLDVRKVDLEKAIAASMETMRETSNTIPRDSTRDAIALQLKAQRDLLANEEAQLAAATEQLAAIQAHGVRTPKVAAVLADHPVHNDLLTQQVKIVAELKKIESLYEANHPAVQRARAQSDALAEKIDAIEAIVVADVQRQTQAKVDALAVAMPRLQRDIHDNQVALEQADQAQESLDQEEQRHRELLEEFEDVAQQITMRHLMIDAGWTVRMRFPATSPAK